MTQRRLFDNRPPEEFGFEGEALERLRTIRRLLEKKRREQAERNAATGLTVTTLPETTAGVLDSREATE